MTARQERSTLLLPLAVIALVALPVLSPEVQLFYRDTGRLYYPVKKFLAEELRAGRLPLWDPWTEAGTSILAQVTPALFHPFTLLYLPLPFDLAFKLNHLLALPLAAIGAWLLARKLSASAWGAAAGATAYACSGYLLSMAASNLPYAVGPATMPLAIHGLLRFVELPRPGRLLWAAFALALCMLAGEPQAMLFAGVIGSAIAIGLQWQAAADGARAKAAGRAALLLAAWGACALALAAPAAFPALARLPQSQRAAGVSSLELDMFSNSPRRLPGLVIPFAFDDQPVPMSVKGQRHVSGPFEEYFVGSSTASFTDSIHVGVPAALLALLALARRRGRWLVLGAMVCVLASAGPALGIQELLLRLVPGLRLFRYAEKFLGPASLLIALAAALGLDEAARFSRRAGALAILSAAAALASGALWLWARHPSESAISSLRSFGATHSHPFALWFFAELAAGSALTAAIAAVVGVVALWRWWSAVAQRFTAPLLGLTVSAAAIATASDALLFGPVELLHPPFPLAEELLKTAGPSAGRWRLFSSSESIPRFQNLDNRSSAQVALKSGLIEQIQALAGIESANEYFSARDTSYTTAIGRVGPPMLELLTVRFVVLMPAHLNAFEAREFGYRRIGPGYWIHELPAQPRARIARGVRVAAPKEALELLADPAFVRGDNATVRPADAEHVKGLAEATTAPAGVAELRYPRPGRIEVRAAAASPALALISEHFDPGWSATVDGQPAKVLRAQETLLGVRVGRGTHRIELAFWPIGLTSGVLVAAACTILLTTAAVLTTRRRRVLSSG